MRQNKNTARRRWRGTHSEREQELGREEGEGEHPRSGEPAGAGRMETASLNLLGFKSPHLHSPLCLLSCVPKALRWVLARFSLLGF